MIVDSMTHEEVYHELERDREAYSRWWRHQLNGMKRPMLKSTTFPRHVWREYTSPRRNKYLFFTRVFDKRMKAMLTGIAALRQTSDGLTIYTTWLDRQKLISPMVLIPHMWKRYAERVCVDKKGIDLVKHYFMHNAHGKDSHNQRAVGRSVRYNGEEHLACCVNEGVLLGQQYGDMFVARTFITYDMCCGQQQQEFEGCKRQILTDKEMYEHAKQYYL